jgi:hypothetical protein
MSGFSPDIGRTAALPRTAARGQQKTFADAAKNGLLDNRVGGNQQRRWYGAQETASAAAAWVFGDAASLQ